MQSFKGPRWAEESHSRHTSTSSVGTQWELIEGFRTQKSAKTDHISVRSQDEGVGMADSKVVGGAEESLCRHTSTQRISSGVLASESHS